MKTTVKAKQYFFTLNITYYMQAFAVLAFGAVVGFLITFNKTAPAGDTNTWVYIVSIVLVSAVVMAYFVFRLLLSKINPQLRLQEKMPRYARALLVRSSLIEIPGLVASIAAFITANINFLAISLLVFIIFLFLRPTKDKIVEDLSLSQKEKQMLYDESATISETHS